MGWLDIFKKKGNDVKSNKLSIEEFKHLYPDFYDEYIAPYEREIIESIRILKESATNTTVPILKFNKPRTYSNAIYNRSDADEIFEGKRRTILKNALSFTKRSSLGSACVWTTYLIVRGKGIKLNITDKKVEQLFKKTFAFKNKYGTLQSNVNKFFCDEVLTDGIMRGGRLIVVIPDNRNKGVYVRSICYTAIDLDGVDSGYITSSEDSNTILAYIPYSDEVALCKQFPNGIPADNVEHFAINRVGAEVWGASVLEPVLRVIASYDNAFMGYVTRVEGIGNILYIKKSARSSSGNVIPMPPPGTIVTIGKDEEFTIQDVKLTGMEGWTNPITESAAMGTRIPSTLLTGNASTMTYASLSAIMQGTVGAMADWYKSSFLDSVRNTLSMIISFACDMGILPTSYKEKDNLFDVQFIGEFFGDKALEFEMVKYSLENGLISRDIATSRLGFNPNTDKPIIVPKPELVKKEVMKKDDTSNDDNNDDSKDIDNEEDNLDKESDSNGKTKETKS